MRYIIGIDLGTTNSCTAYIDTQSAELNVKIFKIPQLTAAGVIESLSTLPSFCYLPSPSEFPDISLKLPWTDLKNPQRYILGSFAKKQGAKVPTKLVQSAKSWLCHSAANRKDKILPIEAADESFRISPIEATVRYLSHIRNAWDEIMAKGDAETEFDSQQVVLTVPASFDEVARSLTVDAAKKAGFLHLTLLEEPQAAFYSWIAQHEKSWEQQLVKGSQILVCDVGGGTTDFSLIEVGGSETGFSFRRMAVGDHLLLGGDNMDAALAHYLEAKFKEKGQQLSTTQRQQLFHEARAAKEKLLSSPTNERTVIVLYGEGSNVVKGTISIEVYQHEVQDLMLNGFFGKYPWNDAKILKKAAGFRSMGLPYENEPSIIKHLAQFLSQNSPDASNLIKPDFVLFNGGAMAPQIFQNAVIANLNAWFPEKQLNVLSSYHLDLAVARGAAYYGRTKRGLGVKIGGGLARSYYLMLDTKNSSGVIEKKALTIMPRGSEEGEIFEHETTFLLTPNTPVSFEPAASHVRLHDRFADLVEINSEEMHFLPPIHTVLKYGKQQFSEENKIPVHLVTSLSPIGTLEISLKSLNTNHRWALEFQLRAATGQDNSIAAMAKRSVDQTFDSEYLKEALNLIRQVFGPEKINIKLSQLPEKLEELLEIPKKEWPPSIMRGLADEMLKVSGFRKNSQEHMGRWWNLIGFLLRPGFGFPLDDFRIKELWKIILQEMKAQLTPDLQIQLWICYRRIAGGLNKGQQMQLASELISTLFSKRSGKIEVNSKTEAYSYSEKIRLLASMELLEMPLKVRLGNALVARIQAGQASSVDYWALGRIGARHLLYGTVVNVISKELCEEWILKVLDVPCKEEKHPVFLLEQLARKTENSGLNVSLPLVETVLLKFSDSSYSERLQELLLKESRLSQSEQEFIFGDSLPSGLLLDLLRN